MSSTDCSACARAEEQMPPWIESLIKSNHLVAQAMMSQARANSELALAINQLLAQEAEGEGISSSPKTYLDGSPR